MMRLLSLIAAVSGLLISPALADTYTVSFGQRQLGTLTFEGQRSKDAVLVTLNNAPFGIKNGTFQAVAQSKGDSVDYLAMNRGSETRDITILREAGVVQSVEISPASEMTEMSDAANVPAGVIFPAEVFAALATAQTCPAPMSMYDGRRVVQIATTAMDKEGETVTCDMSYRVVMGPGYISPFYFKSFGMQLDYTDRKLAQITMGAGGFSVHLIRQ